MRVLIAFFLLSGFAQADLRTVEAPLPETNQSHQSGHLYQTIEGTGLPVLVERTGTATANLSNLNGSLMTITGGNANITGVVWVANDAQNKLGGAVMRGLTIEGAARSIQNHIGGMFISQ